MFFFGFQDGIRKIMLKGKKKKKTFSFLPLFSDSGPTNLELKHLEQDYAPFSFVEALSCGKAQVYQNRLAPQLTSRTPLAVRKRG